MFDKFKSKAENLKNKIKAKAREITEKVKAKARSIANEVKRFCAALDAVFSCYFHKVLKGTAAEAYVDTGVKVLIAVVLGALLLALLYALFNDTIMPNVKAKVIELFNYAG